MKVFHRLAVPLCAGLLFSAVVVAQDNAPAQNQPAPIAGANRQLHVERPEVRLNNISKRVNLTDDQKAKLKPILESQYQQITDVLKNSSLTADEQKSKVQQIRKSIRPQIMSLLTPEQKKQWRETEAQEHPKQGAKL
jgi:Spy/CpxP family protein refolding chaperone